MTIRTFSQLSDALIHALPSQAEICALTDDQLVMLGNLSNLLDNIRYLERKRRDDEAAKATEVKS